ncbi:hypothetical protein B0H16DRAFT_1487895 [Mycena metata]|uniref:Uncharacterized protein n=1 Tax=Mycena metata TaxID=1033252 RepID=A0AAD7KKL6_9AGAR|nr:hypothetical protein B0H16DRAFT_1487895 [Mycena metata]
MPGQYVCTVALFRSALTFLPQIHDVELLHRCIRLTNWTNMGIHAGSILRREAELTPVFARPTHCFLFHSPTERHPQTKTVE